MNRNNNNIPFNPSAVPQGPVPQTPRGRIPLGFQEAMAQISGRFTDNMKATDMAVQAPPAPRSAGKSNVSRWISSFTPLGKQHDSLQDESASCPERMEFYDPFSPALNDSDHQMPEDIDHKHSSLNQENNLGRRRLSPSKGCSSKSRWDKPYSKTRTSPLGRQNFCPETRPTNSQHLSPGHRLPEGRVYSTDTESHFSLGSGAISRPLDHRIGSPDQFIHGLSTQRFPTSHGAQSTNGEDEMTTTGRSSPSRLKQEGEHQLECSKMGLDKIKPPFALTRNRSKSIIMDKSPIICDLCDVEVASGQELNDHLESKTHWDTLEHIQQENNYDDMMIAFLQEVMLYRSRQCSRAVEDSVLQALQENDHMTKIEIFHCAACSIFLPTSASSVHAHITSQEHLSNTTEFEVQQRRACLAKAENMMKKLKPQFEHFLKGGHPFE